MIHLDANVLIGLRIPDKRYALFHDRLLKGEAAAVSAIAWHEFVCGPLLPDEIQRALALISNNVVPLDRDAAELGAFLYNKLGRRRGSNADCLIAASAISADAELFTFNLADFEPFKPFGLRLL